MRHCMYCRMPINAPRPTGPANAAIGRCQYCAVPIAVRVPLRQVKWPLAFGLLVDD